MHYEARSVDGEDVGGVLQLRLWNFYTHVHIARNVRYAPEDDDSSSDASNIKTSTSQWMGLTVVTLIP